MRLSQWLARFLTPDTVVAQGRVRRRTSSTAPSLYVRRLEDRRVLTVDVVDLQPITIAENSAANTLVGTLTVNQSLPAQTVTYSITAGNTNNAFLINSSGQLRVATAAALDFETTPTFSLTVRAQTATNGSDTSIVTVNLSNVAEARAITLTGSSATMALVGNNIRVTAQDGTVLFNESKAFTTSLTINGTTTVNTLTVDFNGGNPIPTGGLIYDGLGPTTTPGDALIITGGAFDTAVYTFTNAHDGTIALTSGATTSTITYRNLEPVSNSGTATNIVLTLSSVDDNAVLEDVGGGQLRLRSFNLASPTFEATTFTAPTGTLTLNGGAGNDTITVTPLTGTFTLNIDGGASTTGNTLVIDQINPAVATADQFRFAGFTFDQTLSFDTLTKFVSGQTPTDQPINSVLTINSAVGNPTTSANFPSTLFGFNSALTIGRLANLTLTSGTLALNMPSGDDGTTRRSGFELSWADSSKSLTNVAGDDFVVYEASTTAGTQDAAMISVHIVGGGWTQWYYEPKDSRESYPGSGQGAFATGIDLSNLGLADGAKIDKIRYVNMIAADRMVGPGYEKVAGSGEFFGTGFVIPGGGTSTVLPDPGDNANYNYFGSTTLDPDPLYFGILHPLGSASGAGAGNDTITVNGASVGVTVDGTVKVTVGYASMSTLRINTREGTDTINVSLQSTLPATIALDGGAGADQVKLIGTTGAQTIALTGTAAKVDGKAISFSNVESLTVDTQAPGTGDSVTVDGSFHLVDESSSLHVRGGVSQNDQLTVTRAPQLYTVGGQTFDQTATPNVYTDLPIAALDGGHGVVVNTIPVKTSDTGGTSSISSGFPLATAGFDNSLSLGALVERNTSPTSFRFMGLPDASAANNTNTGKRSGFLLTWSDDRVLRNIAGMNEFVFYESGSIGTPEPVMVQVHNAQTGVWSDWIYKVVSAAPTTSAGVAFTTVYDLSDFGVAVGDTVDAVRVVNMISTDRMIDSSGVGVVKPAETILPGEVYTVPYAGPTPLSSSPTFPLTSFDADPMYFGALHSTSYAVSLDPDSVDVAGYMPITYEDLAKVTLETGSDVDMLTITPSTKTEYVVRSGLPLISTNPGDQAALVLTGVTNPTFNVGAIDGTGHTTGTLVSASHKQVSFTGIDRFTANLPMNVVVDATANNAAGTDKFLVTRNATDDEIFVNNKLVFRAQLSAIDNLKVNGSTDIDELTVERAAGDPVPGGGITFAAGLGADKLTVQGGTATDLKHTISGALAGKIDLDGSLVNYTGTETVVDTVTAANREFQFAGVDDVIDLEDHTDPDMMIFSGATTPDIRFKNPTESLKINLGGGDDLLTIASVDAGFNTSLSIAGEAGDDEVTIDAALTLGSAAAKGDLTITAEKVNLNKSIDTTGSALAGSVGNVTLSVDDLLKIGDDGDIKAKGDVLIDGGGDVETEGDIKSTNENVTIKNSTVLKSDVTVTADKKNVTFDATVDSESGEFNKLTVSAVLGTVTFEDAVGSADPLRLVRVDAKSVIVNGVVTSEVAGGTGGEIVIHADEVELNAGGGLVVDDGLGVDNGFATIVTLTDGVGLTVGADAIGKLGLDVDEVKRIKAGTFRFGDARSGNIWVVNTSTFTDVDTLHLTTGAGISGLGAIKVPNLALTSVDDITLNGANDVDTLSAVTTRGAQVMPVVAAAGISFTDINKLKLSSNDFLDDVTTNAGSVELIVGTQLTQDATGAITSKYLRLGGTGTKYKLDDAGNEIDILTGSITGFGPNGTLDFGDIDGLAIGSDASTEGLTTDGGTVLIGTAGGLDFYRAINVASGIVGLDVRLAIEDTGPVGPKVVADRLLFRTTSGIGNTKPFETSVKFVSGSNANMPPTLAAGTISLKDTSAGALSIDLGGLRNDSGGGISVVHTTGTLQIDAPIENSGGSGDIFLQAGGDLVVKDSTPMQEIFNSGTGSIYGKAGGVVTLANDVLIESGTGKLTGIPPQLSNVVAPQIANTGAATVTFDYGRLLEYNFTANVNWADGTFDLLALGDPGSSGTSHVYTGNPNFTDPAAPIPITVTLRSDGRIHFDGYETTAITVLAEFPGDGVRNVRIDTTAKVPHLVAPPPTRITDIPQSVSPAGTRSQVTGGAGLVAGSEKEAERILILREVLPSGREGTEMQFNQAMLNRLDEIYAKLRNGKYRLYLYDPAEQKLRKVFDVYIKDGKPAAAEDMREQRQDRPDGASLPPNSEASEAVVADDANESDDETNAAPKRGATQPSLAAGSLAVGAGLVVASSQPWHEQVDAALEKFRRYSPLRSRSNTRRTPR